MEKSVRRPALIAIYIAFVCKGLFYAAVIPIWEGYDEYAHFAFIQRVAVQHELPVPDTRISREVEQSLELVPLPWELRDLPPPHVIHDSFWKLTPEQRTTRQRDLLAIPADWRSQPGTIVLYEGKQ